MKGTELERIEQQANEIISESVVEANTASLENELFFLLGGQDAMGTIADNLLTTVIFTYQRIRDEKLYLASGFQTFADFMDNHPKSRMSYKRFNYVEGVYKNLGPVTFDLMSGSGLSMRQMKQLGKGNIQIDGEHLIINTDDGPQHVDISNRRQWLDAVQALAKSNADKSAKLEKQKETIAKHDDEKRDLYNAIDREKARKTAEIAADPHMIAVVELQIAYRRLADAVDALSEADKKQFVFAVLEKIASCDLRLREAYGVSETVQLPTRSELTGDDETDYINSLMDRVEADENDAALAAQI